eukprot:TRINITY_DN7876_c0_g1_i1.p1 TRINITY_DN7876_c0_g1~~TRINITY_DN7876_c0_g1_i1.p1  ORF type:complete len:350 (-),score=109.26 TRINITY_DN7876_c0_g1_i1:174-1223(-)
MCCFFFSSRRRHTRQESVSWARRCVQETEAIEALGWEVKDHGDISAKNTPIPPADPNKTYKTKIENDELLGAMNHSLHKVTKAASADKNFVLTIGGDHSVGSGSISGLRETYENLKVIWIDAHGDCIIPEFSDYPHYHGMPAAHLLGWIPDGTVKGFDWFSGKLKVEDIVYIGIRDIDADEKVHLKKFGVKYFCMDSVDELGIGETVRQALAYLDPKNEGHPIHITFDVDGIDPLWAPGTGTRSRGGLTYREANYLLRKVANTGNLVGLDIVEINPALEPNKAPREVYHGDNKLIKGTETVCLGIELAISALGRTLVQVFTSINIEIGFIDAGIWCVFFFKLCFSVQSV